ncbi:hypothetical protein [Vibrio sp. D431a]|uniref:hypothetical protein n=1 Tax=Vibrio sp. D431a TaxID=2837388 RepID=UPI0025543A02|nr:hypothetical protein [Vibrio sp. D431a]MDK9789939.1 hypothetical protein [Vibrio sp. D431a]
MQELLDLKAKFEANLSVAVSEIENLTQSTFTERLPIARFCLDKAAELGKDLAAEFLTLMDEMQLEAEANTSEISSLNDKITELKNLQSELSLLNNQLNEAKEQLGKETSKIKTLEDDILLANKELLALRKLPLKVKELESIIALGEKSTLKLNKSIEMLETQLETQKRVNQELQQKSPKTKSTKEVTVKGRRNTYFISIVEHPLESKIVNNERVSIVSDLKWHLRILSSNGIAVFPAINEWLNPILPHCKEFSEDWTPKVNEAVLNAVLTRAKDGHIHLVNRVTKAKNLKISKKDFSEEEVRWLKAANMKDAYTALRLSYTSFTFNIRKNSVSEEITDYMMLELHKKIKKFAISEIK